MRKLAFNPLVVRAVLIITITVFIGLFGNRHYVQTDLTATGRHTLLPQSMQVLDLFGSTQTANNNGSIDVDVYISPDDQQRTYIERLLEKYARYKSCLLYTSPSPRDS